MLETLPLWEALKVSAGSLLGVPLGFRQRAYSLRVLLASWLLVCVVLSAAYQGQLLSSLTIDNQPRVDSLEELLEIANRTGLTIKADFFSIVSLMYDTNLADRSALALTLEKIQLVMDAAQLVQQVQQLTHSTEPLSEALLVGPDSAHPIAAWLPALIKQRRLGVLWVALPYQSALFLSRRGSLFDEPVRRLLGRLRSAGFSVSDEAKLQTQSVRAGAHPLDFKDMMPALYLHGAGLLLATAVLLAECAWISFGGSNGISILPIWPKAITRKKVAPVQGWLIEELP